MQLLPHFQEYNVRGKQTVLFIHSPLSTGDQWAGVLFYLQTYMKHLHILIPSFDAVDLSSSSRAVSLLSNLIRERARRGVAHVIGLGTGAHIATLLAQDNGMLVSTLLVSGYRQWTLLQRLLLPYGLFAAHKLHTYGT